MKKNIIFLVLSLLVFTNCNREELFTNYTDIVYRQYFDLPAGIGVFDVHHFYMPGIPSKYAESLLNANIKKEDVTKVLTTQGSISGLFGDVNLEFVDRVSIRAFADGDPTNYIEIAYRDPSPINPGNAIGLIPSLASSQEFFSAETVNLDIVIYLRATTTENVQMQLDLTMRAGY